MSKRPVIGTCYLCGETREVELDHVPPKFLSPSSPRTDFLFAPACSSCNRGFSTHEEILRNFLATGFADSKNPSVVAAQNKMLSSFEKGKITRRALHHPHKQQILDHSKQISVYSKAGIYLGEAMKISIPPEAELFEVFIKIARGLHYHHYKEVLTDQDLLHAEYYPTDAIESHPEVFNDAASILPIKGACGDFFGYAGYSAHLDGKTVDVWMMEIYDRLLFSVGINLPHHQKDKQADSQ